MSLSLIADANCKLCKLSQGNDNVCQTGLDEYGTEHCEVLIVSPGPSPHRDKLVQALLVDVWLEDTPRTYAVSCTAPGGRSPKKAEIRACNKWLQARIEAIKPKYVLLFGATALSSIDPDAKITKLHGRPFEQGEVTYLATFDPTVVAYDPGKLDQIKADLKQFQLMVENGGIIKEEGLNYQIVDSWGMVRKMVADLKAATSVACDTETSGLYPWAHDAKVQSIGFATENHQWCIPVYHPESMWSRKDVDTILELVAEAIENTEMIGHNGKFDSLWLLVTLGFQIDFGFDTMLAHFLVDENSRHGLKHLAKVYYSAPDYEISTAGKQGQVPLEEHCEYLALDVFYTRKLRFSIGKQLDAEPSVKRVFEKILMPCSQLFVEIERHGVYINTDQMDEVEIKLNRDIVEAKALLDTFAKNVNWGSPQQVAKVLFQDLGLRVIEMTAGGKPSTSESVINQIDHPLGEALIRYRGAKQQLSFFIEGWKPFLRNSRLHPSFKLHGTVTGRLSCEHPNLQQVPRDPLIRSLITAPPGWTLLEVDLSQIELRVAAELSGDPELIHCFREGIDVHWRTMINSLSSASGDNIKRVIRTAEEFSGLKDLEFNQALRILRDMGPQAAQALDDTWKELRKKAKAVAFGYLYGMWWKRFRKYALDSYGVKITDNEAQQSRIDFFELYKSLPAWHKRQRAFANRNGYVTSLSGRKRRLPAALAKDNSPECKGAERQAINAPVQSFANELNLMALIQLIREFPRDVKPIGTVHDAILMEVRNARLREVHDRVLEIMKRPDLMDEFEINLVVPILAEASVGPWGKGKSLEKWLSLQ